MSKPFKLMLAANKLEKNLHLLDQLPYPGVWSSRKYDGIRSARRPDQSWSGPIMQYSRSTDDKITPNRYIQSYMAGLPIGLDGELIVGKETDAARVPDQVSEVYRRSMSGVQSHDGEPDFKYIVFGTFTDLKTEHAELQLDAPFEQRLDWLMEWYERENIAKTHPRIIIAPQRICESKEDLLAYEEEDLELGYEGSMLMLAGRGYKCGRPTLSIQKTHEGACIKLKRENDENGDKIGVIESTAKIIGFKEGLHNANEARKDVTGRTRRQGLKENMVPMGTLGSLLCEDPMWPKTFSMRGNLSHEELQMIWDAIGTDQDWLGTYVDYTYQERGSYLRPRFPRFLRRRMDGDQ